MRKVLAMVVVLVGCGGGGGGAATPDDVVKGLIEAARAGDGAKAASFFPSPEVLAEHIDCPADAPMLKRITSVRAEIGGELQELKALAFVRRETTEDKEQVFKAGEKLDDCTAKQDVTALKTRIVFKDERGEDADMMRFIRLGERWYLAGK